MIFAAVPMGVSFVAVPVMMAYGGGAGGGDGGGVTGVVVVLNVWFSELMVSRPGSPRRFPPRVRSR